MGLPDSVTNFKMRLLPVKKNIFKLKFISILSDMWRHDALMASELVPGSSGPGSSPGRGLG